TDVEGHLGRAQTAVGTLSSKATTAFGAMGGILKSSFGEALGPVGAAVESLQGTVEKLHQTGGKAGKAMLAAGAGTAAMGGLVLAAADPIEKAHAGLKQVVDNTGASFEEFAPKVESTVKHMENFGHTSADTQNA